MIFVHGYLDHSACGHHLINRLVAEGYNVATYDHPGHGLSGGRRVSTDDFAIYEETLSDFVNIAQSELPAPYDVVAHSMGGTVVIDHLQAHQSTPLRRIILIAPMIKDGSPKHLKRFCHAISPLVDYLPRFPENSSSDPELAACIKSDPLQSRYVSTHWSRSFSRWRRQDRIRQATPSDRSPLVISAGIETVIDEPASNRWMRNAFPNGRFVTIDGAHHQLLNEAEAKRAQVLNMICDELSR